MTSSFRLLVFDWDGTLADSEAKIVECFRQAVEDIGEAAIEDARLRRLIGLGLPEIAMALYPDRDQGLHERFVDAYRSRWLAPEAPNVELFAGTRPTLEALRERGYAMAVATGKSRRGLDRELRETGLSELFELTRCADESRSKPDPYMLHEILTHTATTPEQALMIGDSVHDLRMARSAGVAALAVGYGMCERDELLHHEPLACLDRIEDLLEHLPSRSS